jgi:hypothetical protein
MVKQEQADVKRGFLVEKDNKPCLTIVYGIRFNPSFYPIDMKKFNKSV